MKETDFYVTIFLYQAEVTKIILFLHLVDTATEGTVSLTANTWKVHATVLRNHLQRKKLEEGDYGFFLFMLL